MTDSTVTAVAQLETSLPAGHSFKIEDAIREHATELIDVFKNDLVFYANELWSKHLILKSVRDNVLDQTSGMASDRRADRLFSSIHNTVKSELNSNKKAHIFCLISILEKIDQKPLALKLRNRLKGIGIDVISEPVRGTENTSFYNDQHRLSYQIDGVPEMSTSNSKKSTMSVPPPVVPLPPNMVSPEPESIIRQHHTDGIELDMYSRFSQESDQKASYFTVQSVPATNSIVPILNGHQQFQDTKSQQIFVHWQLREELAGLNRSFATYKSFIETVMKTEREDKAKAQEELKRKCKEELQEKKDVIQQKEGKISELEQELKTKAQEREQQLERRHNERHEKLESLLSLELEKKHNELLSHLINHQTELERQTEKLKQLEDLLIKDQKDLLERLSKDQLEEFKRYCFIICFVFVVCTALILYF